VERWFLKDAHNLAVKLFASLTGMAARPRSQLALLQLKSTRPDFTKNT